MYHWDVVYEATGLHPAQIAYDELLTYQECPDIGAFIAEWVMEHFIALQAVLTQLRKEGKEVASPSDFPKFMELLLSLIPVAEETT